MDIIELKNQISSANKAYRSGNPTMSDQAWDDLLESLQKQIPEDEFDAFRATLHEVMMASVADSTMKVESLSVQAQEVTASMGRT